MDCMCKEVSGCQVGASCPASRVPGGWRGGLKSQEPQKLCVEPCGCELGVSFLL